MTIQLLHSIHGRLLGIDKSGRLILAEDGGTDFFVVADPATGRIGTTSLTGVTVEEYNTGIISRTRLLLSNAVVEVISVTTGAGVGGSTVYDFPEGWVNVLGARSDLSISIATAKQSDFTDATPEGDMGLGTLAPANADALGTDATDDSLCTKQAFTMSSYADSSVVLPPDATGFLIDGTSAAVNAVVTVLVDSGDIDDSVTTEVLISGTIEIFWLFLGDQ